ncbi:aminotransferase class I/II-fold pyridoxal phosphate-dependent enzyme [Euzebya pacifica]|mgnify:CR=1 FL=1|uniref:aminotransferase class I/II-fold pyridoxal phosphate-dependent enzyme n=1 Tax=Euzebya pacifica TaxID=1608957 RepID=UPI0030F6645A
MNPVLARLGGYPLAAFQDLARQMRAEDEPSFDFSIGDPVEPTPPFIRQALIDAVPEVSQYPTAAGVRPLREAIAGWVQRRFGVEVDPDLHVLPTSGSKEGIFHAPLGLLDAGSAKRHCIWGSPGYQPYERGTLFAGGESDCVDLSADEGWLLHLDRLPADRLDRAFIAWLNYPHNPTGAVAEPEWLRAQLAVAREHGIVMGSDECYVDIHPPAGPLPTSMLEVADGDLTGVLVAFSLSKRSGMTGYRCGALVGDPDLIAAQRTMRPNIGSASPEFVQHAAAAAWADDVHVAERREVFEAKRRVMQAFCDEVGLEVSGSAATFYLWLRAPGGDDRAYAQALLARRIIASPGSAFGPAGAGWLRLALVPSVDGCHEAAAAWRQAIDDGVLPT